MKKIILLFVLFITGITVNAQESKFSFGADVQSRYIWRGLQFGGSSPSLQPNIEYVTGKFTIGAWGAYSLGGNNTAQELDTYISYAINEVFSFTVTDYFFPTDGALNNYLEYGSATGHVFEATVAFSGSESFPIGITVATNFGGAIKDASGDKSYSTYVEASYAKTVGATEVNFFAGAVFGDNNGYYATTGAGFINLGLGLSKSIKITDSYSLPVNTQLVINPDAENIFLTFGFSL